MIPFHSSLDCPEIRRKGKMRISVITEAYSHVSRVASRFGGTKAL